MLQIEPIRRLPIAENINWPVKPWHMLFHRTQTELELVAIANAADRDMVGI